MSSVLRSFVFSLIVLMASTMAFAQRTANLTSLCNNPVLFSGLNSDSSIYVFTEDHNIACDLKLNSSVANSSLVFSFVSFDYDCSQIDFNDVRMCEGTKKVLGKNFYESFSPIVNGSSQLTVNLSRTSSQGDLKILATLVTASNEAGECVGSLGPDNNLTLPTFKCDDGFCIFGDFKCDENTNCLDGSDESFSTCHSYSSSGLGAGWIILIVIVVVGVVGFVGYKGYQRYRRY